MKKILLFFALMMACMAGFAQPITGSDPTLPRVVTKNIVVDSLHGSRYGSGVASDTIRMDSACGFLFDDGTFLDRGIDTTNELGTKDWILDRIDSLGELLPSFDYTDSIAHTKGWIFPFPDSFNYRPPFHVLKNPNTGEYLIDPNFNLRQYASIPAGVTYYVDVINGSDSNSGLTALLPYRSLSLATAKTDVSRIYVADGYYWNRYSFNAVVPTQSIEIIATGDNAILTTDFRDLLTFTSEGNLYKAYSTLNPGQVWDRRAGYVDAYGDPKTYTRYASRSEVDTSTVGAYYWAADTLYVKRIGGGAPNDSLFCGKSALQINLTGEGLKYYFQGFKAMGNAMTVTSTNGTGGGVRLYVDSCEFIGGNSFFDGCSEVFLFNSTFAKSNTDILNYDPAYGVSPKIVEYNIDAYNNLEPGISGTTNQASTAHIGCQVLRLNSFYAYTQGQNVADVDSCQSWMINCEFDSCTVTGSANFFSGTGDHCIAWLQDCESYNRPPSGYDISGSGSTIYINGFISDNYDYDGGYTLDSNYTFALREVSDMSMTMGIINARLAGTLPSGSNGQTLSFSGSRLTSNSFLYNSGTRIGIGTTSPQSLLHLNTSGNADLTVYTSTSGATSSIIFGSAATVWYMGLQGSIASGEFRINAGGIPLATGFNMSTSGNVGLGKTSSALYRLDAEGAVRIATTPLSTNGTDSIAGILAGTQQVVKIARGVFMQNLDTVASGNITFVTTTTHYSFSGTTATWTLPTVAASDGVTWFIKNRGSGDLTINTAAAGNDIYSTSAVNTITVAAGASVILHNDGTYFTTQ